MKIQHKMANEILTEKDRIKIRDMELFLINAFCIDGECNYIENVEIKSTLIGTKNNMLFALGDTLRGLFYVTISK